jgi:hypothetical protein
MNWLQFLASLVSSLAWPIAVIVFVILLRIPITRVLLTLTRLKYKELELDFGRELKQLEQEAKAINITPQQPKSIAPTKRDSLQLLEEATRLAQDFPESAVVVGWQAVEGELMSAVMRVRDSALKNAQLLTDQNRIDDRTLAILDRMRILRNKVVHRTYGDSPARDFV